MPQQEGCSEVRAGRWEAGTMGRGEFPLGAAVRQGTQPERGAERLRYLERGDCRIGRHPLVSAHEGKPMNALRDPAAPTRERNAP